MPPRKKATGKKKRRRKKKVQASEESKVPAAPESAVSSAALGGGAGVQGLSVDERKALAGTAKDAGNQLFGERKYKDAIVQYGAAIELDPSNRIFWSNRSAAYLKLGKGSDAVADAIACVKLDPEWEKGYVRLADAQNFTQQYARAVETCKKGLLLDSTNARLKAAMEIAKAKAAEVAAAAEAAAVEARAQQDSGERKHDPIIGIDLGTTYSCVAVWKDGEVHIISNEDGDRTTASVVAFHPDRRVIGNAAKAQASSNPLNTVYDVKRIIGQSFSAEQVQKDVAELPFTVVAGSGNQPLVEVDYLGQRKRLAPEEISAMVLAKMKETAERFLGHPVSRAVITVPAYFNDQQRAATKNAGMIAGLKVMRIINEPTAAALAYGLDVMGTEVNAVRRVLVFDLGGGTFDVSLLTIDGGIFTVEATAGDTHLGGEDFDNLLLEKMATSFSDANPGHDIRSDPRAMKRLRQACEAAKRALSASPSATIDIENVFPGVDFNVTITRAEFDTMSQELFARCIKTVKRVLKDAKVNEKEVSDVVLVGGSTRIPRIQEMLQDFLKKPNLCRTINPDEAVAYGAAVQGAILSGERHSATQQLLLVDVTPLSLGIETTGRVMSTLIKRNTAIPARKTKTYTTESDFQTEVDVSIYEGERQCVDGNNLLGEFRITGIERAKRGVPQVDVTFDIDANGILNVTAVDQTTGAEAAVTIANDRGRLSDDEIERMIRDAQRYQDQDAAHVATVEARNSLERLVYFVIEESQKAGHAEAGACAIEVRDWLEAQPTASLELLEQKKAMLNRFMRMPDEEEAS